MSMEIISPIHREKSSFLTPLSILFNPSIQAAADEVTFNRLVYPYFIIGLALLVAIVYTIIPNSNIWVYILLKQELWSVFGIAIYAELTILCIPDFPNSLYIAQYVAGSTLPLLIRVIAYFAKGFNNPSLQLFCSIVGLPITIVLLIRNAMQYEGKGTSSTEECYYDMFGASIIAVGIGGDLEQIDKGERITTTPTDNNTNSAYQCSVGRSRWRETLMRNRCDQSSSSSPSSISSPLPPG
ncbi:hypothetical protein EON65_57885, partial [archaeon]